MEGANYFNKSDDYEKEYKMDIENSRELDRSNMVKNYIQSRRTMNSNLVSKNENKIKRLSYSPSKKPELNFDVVKTIGEVMNTIKELCPKNQYTFQSFPLGRIESENMKNKLLKNLKKIRIFLNKESIPEKDILQNNIQDFIESLIGSFKQNSDHFIQLESLWIINNLIYFTAKYNENVLDTNKIANFLIEYLVTVLKGDEKVKYSLLEIIYRIFGNLIYINNNIIDSLIKYNVISIIVEQLNNPVLSFRITCLWLLNKILIILERINSPDNINILLSKNAISNYKFILSRIKNNVIFDEISEFFWLITELAKYNPKILIPIFLSKNIQYNINSESANFEYAIEIFSFILDNSLTNKLSQISIRLISDLLVICDGEIKNENLLTKFIEYFFEKKSIILFINDVLNSPKNKYDISLVKDVILLIFNLLCLAPIKASIFFKKGIVNLISDRDYHNNVEMMKLLFLTFYRILISNSFSFEPNDEKVIKTCLVIIKRFKNDKEVIILFIDILYCYLQASRTQIENEIENAMEFLTNDENSNIEIYQNMFLNLANIVKLYSPLSKFMRNI
jgi:hypothetical protein